MKCLNMKLSIFAALAVGSLATDHLTYNMGGGDNGGGEKGKDKADNQASASNMDMSYNQMSSDYSDSQESASKGDMAAQGGSYGHMPASKSDVSGQGNSYGQMPSGHSEMMANQGSAEVKAPSSGGMVHNVSSTGDAAHARVKTLIFLAGHRRW